MFKVVGSFGCGGCLGPVMSAGRAGVDIGAGAGLELEDGFCYLGVEGDADAAVEAGVRVGWSE